MQARARRPARAAGLRRAIDSASALEKERDRGGRHRVGPLPGHRIGAPEHAQESRQLGIPSAIARARDRLRCIPAGANPLHPRRRE
jgi:hypothetical protein